VRGSIHAAPRTQLVQLYMAEASSPPSFLRQRVKTRVSTAAVSTTPSTRARRAGSCRSSTSVSRGTRDWRTPTVSTECTVASGRTACDMRTGHLLQMASPPIQVSSQKAQNSVRRPSPTFVAEMSL
jgi:hypothetical protein